MKKSDLKELIREEIKKVLSENTEDVKDKLPTESGEYKVEYIVADKYPELEDDIFNDEKFWIYIK
jgi:hypothetical protein